MTEGNATDSAARKEGERLARAEAAAVLVLVSAFAIAVCYIVIRQRAAGRGIHVVRSAGNAPTYVIDLNGADVPELMLLPGIGRSRAERIVSWRREHGPFRSFEEVRRATGLSATGMERLRKVAVLGYDKESQHSDEDFVAPDME